MNKIRIKSFPRIHITLIGMNRDGYRINGGIGFSLSNPCLSISFEISTETKIVDNRNPEMTDKEKDKIKSLLETTAKECGLVNKIKCVIENGVSSHFGLGTTTAISMSCVEALFVLNKHRYSRYDVVKYSNRGGTSGVGINTYFDGGFVFDVGIRNDGRLHMPSSVYNPKRIIPLIMKQCKLPMWKIGLCLPNYIKRKTEEEEVEFFEENCPINMNDVENILYESVYGITSSIMENNKTVFCESTNVIQKTKWKMLERALYGNELVELEMNLKQFGASCVGMSSLGPLLYFMGEDIQTIIKEIHSTHSDVICYEAMFNNKGRMIEYD